MSFIPEFDSHVYITNPFYGIQRVNPELCATLDSANQLATLLSDLQPKVILASVWAAAAMSPFYAGMVSWLKFPSGLQILAGALQMEWVRQPSNPDGALRNCRAIIASQETYYAATNQGQNP